MSRVRIFFEGATMSSSTAPDRDSFMLTGVLASKGYDWWWHNFTARHEESGEEKSFFIEYFLCNPALGGDAPRFGDVCDPRPSYGMIKAGCWGKDARQIHGFFGWRDIRVGDAPAAVAMGPNTLSETHMSGAVVVPADEAGRHPEWASDAGSMRWDLRIAKQIAFDVGWGASQPARALNLFEMYWHAQGIKTLFEGWVELDGQRYLVTPETSFGYADKNWGSDFTSPWIWLGSSDLVSKATGQRLEHSALEIGGGRPKVRGLSLPGQALVYLVHEGAAYEFNFSKPWLRTGVTFSFVEGAEEHLWTVEARSPSHRLEVEVRCRRNDMLLMRYQSPDGQRRHDRLWNGGTGYGEARLYERGNSSRPIDTIVLGHVGCEWGEAAQAG
jgi:hypothetical protein